MRDVAVRAAAERRVGRAQRHLPLERRAGVTVGAADVELRVERLRWIDGGQHRALELRRGVRSRRSLEDLTVHDRADDALGEDLPPAGDPRRITPRAFEVDAERLPN